MPENDPENTLTIPELAVGHIGTGKREFPNVAVDSHDAQTGLFYDDYVRNRVVIMHFFSTAGEASYAVMPYLQKIAAALKDQRWQNVTLLSIASDPVNDDVATLQRLAKRYSVSGRWTLLTGKPQTIATLHATVFVTTDGRDVKNSHHHNRLTRESGNQDCSVGLMRYGSDATGFWGSAPIRANTDLILEKLSWVTREPDRSRIRAPLASVKRRGPFPETRNLRDG